MSTRYLDGFAAYAKEATLYQSHQVVLYWMCEGCDEDGRIEVSVEIMRKRTGMGKSTIYGVFQKLEQRGLIERLESTDGTGERSYQVLIPVAELEEGYDSVVASGTGISGKYEIHVHLHPK